MTSAIILRWKIALTQHPTKIDVAHEFIDIFIDAVIDEDSHDTLQHHELRNLYEFILFMKNHPDVKNQMELSYIKQFKTLDYYFEQYFKADLEKQLRCQNSKNSTKKSTTESYYWKKLLDTEYIDPIVCRKLLYSYFLICRDRTVEEQQIYLEGMKKFCVFLQDHLFYDKNTSKFLEYEDTFTDVFHDIDRQVEFLIETKKSDWSLTKFEAEQTRILQLLKEMEFEKEYKKGFKIEQIRQRLDIEDYIHPILEEVLELLYRNHEIHHPLRYHYLPSTPLKHPPVKENANGKAKLIQTSIETINQWVNTFRLTSITLA